jgi:hypothetical protein
MIYHWHVHDLFLNLLLTLLLTLLTRIQASRLDQVAHAVLQRLTQLRERDAWLGDGADVRAHLQQQQQLTSNIVVTSS